MSGKEENLLKQAKRFKLPIPDRIANKPLLKTGLALYYDGFLDLQFDRNGSDRIPWSSIVNYANYYEFDHEQTQRLIFFVRKLDETHKKWLNKKQGT